MCSDTAGFSLHLYSLLQKVSFEGAPISRCRAREHACGGWDATKCSCEEGESVSELWSSAEGPLSPRLGGADLYIIGWEGHEGPACLPVRASPGSARPLRASVTLSPSFLLARHHGPDARPSPTLRSTGSPFKISPDSRQFRCCRRTLGKETCSILSGNSCQHPPNGCTAACASVLLSFCLPCHILAKSVEGQDR